MRDEAAQAYIDGIDPANRPLFDRVDRLILEDHPDADVVISYKMPTYVVGERRLHVAHVEARRVALRMGRRSRRWVRRAPPRAQLGRGTLRLPTKSAGDITDDELRAVLRGALSD